MKFLCDNCKAKYQIGDEKVAGKTVRMKCRRCGHEIQVSAATATEDSVAGPAPVAPVTTAPAPARPAWNEPPDREVDEESTAIMTFPLRPVTKPSGETPAAGTSAPRPGAPPPRPAGAPPAGPPRPAVTGTNLPRPTVTGTSLPRPTVTGTNLPRPAIAGGPAARPAPPAPAPRAPAPAEPSRGVAGAFARSVGAEAEAPAPVSGTGNEGWYVGIAGTPFGPTGVATIRDKIASGEVTPDSLVWREGQGEWAQLRRFPELMELVNAAAAARVAPLAPAAPMLSTPTPAAASPFSAVAAPAPIVAAPAAAPSPAAAAATAASLAASPTPAPVAPPPVAPAPSLTNGASSPSRPLADAVLNGGARPHSLIESPSNGASTANGNSNGSGSRPVLSLLADPFAAPSPASSPLADAPAPPSVDIPKPPPPPVEIDESVVPRRRGGPHPMAYAFIACAAVFGGVAAYVLLSKPQPPVVIIQQMPAQSAAVVASASAAPPVSAVVEVGEPTTDPSGGPVKLTGPMPGGPRPKASGTATAAPIDTSGFTSTIPGPVATAPPPPTNAGGQLSQGEIQGVVAQNQSLVRRKCWQPALEAKPPNAPSNARVNGSITIGASGNVESASASGAEKDFPGLSSCIASRMKGWKFPASGSSTPVNVPFVFAGQ